MTVCKGRHRLRHKRNSGFALLVVVWGIGLIATMVVAFMTSGRQRLQAANNIANAVAAGYVAEAAINLKTLALVSKQSAVENPDNDVAYDGAPQFCIFDGAIVTVSIEDEGGKIDLNASSPETLRSLLLGLGVSDKKAQEVSGSIMAFRASPSATGSGRIALESTRQKKPVPLKQALFETITELDQVDGVDPELYRLLMRFVTVNSRSPGVDARAATPALFAALAGYPAEIIRHLTAEPFPNTLNRKDPRFPAGLNQMSDRSTLLIHAEALLPGGQTSGRDALLNLRPANGKPFAFREWRRSEPVHLEEMRRLRMMGVKGEPDC